MNGSLENNNQAEGQEPLVWYVARSKPGREPAAVVGLRERRFDVYLPETCRLRRTLRGTKPVNSPLVPGYIFVGVGPASPSIYRVTDVAAVADVVRLASGHAAEIRRRADGSHFVYALQAMQASGAFDYTPRAKSWAKGDRVKITTGSLSGQIGDIIEAKPGDRARVMLSGLFAGGVAVDPKHLAAA